MNKRRASMPVVATFTQGVERPVIDSSLTERSTESDAFLSASSLFCLSCLKLCHEQIVLGEDRDDGDVDTDDEPPINQRSSHIFWQVPAAPRHSFAVVLSRCGVSRRRTYQKGQKRVNGHLKAG